MRNGAEIAIVVDPSARGKGLGKALMDRALLKAKVRGAERVVLLCQMHNEPMRRLAHSAGLHAHLEDGEVEGSLAIAQAQADGQDGRRCPRRDRQRQLRRSGHDTRLERLDRNRLQRPAPLRRAARA